MKIYNYNFDPDEIQTKVTDMDNIFNVELDQKNNYVFNLNSTIYFDIPETYIKTSVLKHDMFWPLISYKLYGTTRLAWLLMKINGVKPNQTIDIKHSGDSIKFLAIDKVQDILNNIHNS